MDGIVDYLVKVDRTQLIVGSSVTLVALIGAGQLLLGGNGRQKLLEQRRQLQSIEVGKAKEGEGATRRNSRFPELSECYDPKIRTLYDLWNDSIQKQSSRPCLGTRKKVGEKVGEYEFQTYTQVGKRRDNLASGLLNLGHKTDEPIGLYSINRPEWVIADGAASAIRSPSVALYDTLGRSAVEYIIRHAEIKTVICAAKQFQNILGAASNCPQLKTVISMDSLSKEQLDQAQQAGLRVVFLKDVEEDGAKNPQPQIAPSPVDIYTIMYTSGTTGDPKGVILTHGNIIAELTGIKHHEHDIFTEVDVHISYLPLAHSFERSTTYAILAVGASIGFYQGNIVELFNDIATLRPTFLVGAPRVWSRLYDKMQLTINSGSTIKKKLFEWGFAAKKKALENGSTSPFWDKILFSKTKARIGGRVRFILSGSAPLDPKLGEFLKICFCCNVIEGYGLTENTAGAFITYLSETLLAHVGAPLACNEAKLIDVPEMGYSSKNSPPTGEIVIRGYNVFKGYYKAPEQTKEALEADGWFHTGDIGRWNPNGTLSIIDRKKNIFKLAQGEYVAVEYLEGVFIRSKFVLQVWVYGNSYKPTLIAFVVPDPDTVFPWAKENGLEPNIEQLCRNEKLKKVIFDDLTKVGQEAKLHGFEYIKAITLLHEPFSVDNDCMTPTFKLRRANLLKRYQKQVDDLYTSIDS